MNAARVVDRRCVGSTGGNVDCADDLHCLPE